MMAPAAATVVATLPLVTDDELEAVDQNADAGLPVNPELARRMAAEIRRGRQDLFTLALLGTRTLALLDQLLAAGAGAWPPGCPTPADLDGH